MQRLCLSAPNNAISRIEYRERQALLTATHEDRCIALEADLLTVAFQRRNSGTDFHDSIRTPRLPPEGWNNRVHPFFGIASRGRQLWYFLALF